MPLVQSSGTAYPYTGMARWQVNNLVATSRKMLVVTNPGNSGTVLFYLHNTPTPFTSVSTVPTMALAAGSGGPTAARAMKASLTLVNTTKRLDMGGRVYTLVANQRTSFPEPITASQADWNTFMDEIIAHPHTRCWSGADFQSPKTFLAHPSNTTDYLDFNTFQGTLTPNGFSRVVGDDPNPLPRPMSTIYVVFEVPSATNDYTATARASWYSRWPLESILGQSMKDMPTAPQEHINAIQDHAEHNKDIPVMPAVAGAAVGIGLASAAMARRQRYGGRNGLG